MTGCRPSVIAGNTLGPGFELRLPADWNGGFFFQGGGGDGWLRQASGVIVSGTADRVSALARGFAVVSTDAGHRSEAASPATDVRFTDDMRVRVDNATNAVKQTTAAAKQIITAYYGRSIGEPYFVGCSNGGREGMIEVQSDLASFDGVVSGDPAFDLTASAMAWDCNERALLAIAPKDAPGRPDLPNALTDADLTLLSAAEEEACGTAASCRFDVATLQCRDGKADGCLSAAKVGAIRAIQEGAHDSSLTAIVDWVENGRTPDRLVATGGAFPGTAHPLGRGDQPDAAAYGCEP